MEARDTINASKDPTSFAKVPRWWLIKVSNSFILCNATSNTKPVFKVLVCPSQTYLHKRHNTGVGSFGNVLSRNTLGHWRLKSILNARGINMWDSHTGCSPGWENFLTVTTGLRRSMIIRFSNNKELGIGSGLKLNPAEPAL